MPRIKKTRGGVGGDDIKPVTTKTNTMKSTAQRLGEVYCVLKSDEDAKTIFSVDSAYLMHSPETWGKGDKVMVTDGMLGVWYNSTRTEIPVPHFIDLMHDRIAPWRLEEDGFNSYKVCTDVEVQVDNGKVWMYHKDGSEIINTQCKTYTDLLTLIRLIG